MQNKLEKEYIVEIKNLTCIFNKNNFNEVVAIDDFSYCFEKNKIHYLIGNSGSGKTTLILHLNGLLKLRKGFIRIDDINIYEKKKIKNPKDLRKKISIVFQFPEYQLFKDTIINDVSFGPKILSIPKKIVYLENLEIIKKCIYNNFENIILAYKKKKIDINLNNFDIFISESKFIFSIKKVNKTKKVKIIYKDKKITFHMQTDFSSIKETEYLIAKKYLNILGIDDSYFEKSPFGLSGGQKRRVAIAGILSINPDILIFDEPTAGLDPSGEKEMMNIILESQKNNKTILVVSHNMDHVLETADNVIVMDKGKIVSSGSPYDIFMNKELCEKLKINKPKVIDFIINLINKNPKYSYLLESKPKSIEQLVIEIEKFLGKKNVL